MTLKKIRGGDRLKTGQVNQLIDAFNSQGSSGLGRVFNRNVQPAILCWAVNGCETDLLMGEVASIDSTPYVGRATEIITDNVVLTLREPAEGDEGHWVIAANRIPAGEGGFVYASGICLARLEPSASGSIPGSLCEMTPEERYLTVGSEGTAQLLADLEQPCSVGEGEWGLIRFPIGGGGGGPPRWQDSP